jgi:Leucine-rich repeat (LRR) protein
MEVPCELFSMKNLKELYLNNNNLCSLPSEIAQLTMLEGLYVRLPKRVDREESSRVVIFRSSITSSRLFRPSSVC